MSVNVRRRHLTVGQVGMLTVDVEKLYAPRARARQGTRTDLIESDDHADVLALDVEEPKTDLWADPPTSSAQGRRPAQRAMDMASKVTGASPRVARQAKRVQEKAPDLATKVRSGELPIDRADRIVRDREAAERRQVEDEKGVRPVDTPGGVQCRRPPQRARAGFGAASADRREPQPAARRSS